MDRKSLSEVYYLKKEMKMWELKLAELNDRSLIKAQSVDGMPFMPAGNNSDSTFERIADLIKAQAEVESFRAKIEHKIIEIEKYIMTLDDSLLRQIIEYRCCQCKSWNDTAALIGYGTTSESLRKYFDRRFPKEANNASTEE